MDADERRLNQTTEAVIGCTFNVSNELGAGFLEKVYQNAMFVEVTRAGLKAEPEKELLVRYRGVVVGEYFADLLVEGSVVVELNAVQGLDDVHLAQCLNYLKATGFKICLLINFGRSKIEVRRVVNNF